MSAPKKEEKASEASTLLMMRKEEEEEVGEEISDAKRIRPINIETLAKMVIPNLKANCNMVIHRFFVISLIVSIVTIFSILSPTTTTPKISEKEDEGLLSLSPLD